MLVEESLKIREFIEKQNLQDLSILNIGSADKRFRDFVQPYIQKNIIEPLEKRNCKFTHLDLYGGEGIDIRMDFNNLSQLQGSYDLIFCCNSFEHTVDRKNLGENLVRLTKPGGLIVVTTPKVFPYHLDPIDMLFRPTIEEQHSLLPGTSIVEAEYLTVTRPYESRGIKLPLMIMKTLMIFKSINYKLKGEKYNFFADLKNIKGPWQVTYLAVKRA